MSAAEATNPESGDSKLESKKDATMEVDEEDDIIADMQKMGTNDITARTRLLDNEVRIMKSEIMRLQHEMQAQKDKIKENTEKIKVCFIKINYVVYSIYLYLSPAVDSTFSATFITGQQNITVLSRQCY